MFPDDLPKIEAKIEAKAEATAEATADVAKAEASKPEPATQETAMPRRAYSYARFSDPKNGPSRSAPNKVGP